MILALHERADTVERYLERLAPPNVRAIDVGATSSLAETVARALSALDPLPEEIIVHLADTFIGEPIAPGMTIGVSAALNRYRWTCCLLTPTEEIDAILDRFTDKPDFAPVFIGVYRIPALADFLARLHTALSSPDVHDAFHEALRQHYNATPKALRRLQTFASWHDVGHIDTYYRAKHAHFINTRQFNALAVARDRCAIRKDSRNTQKLLDEIRWYLKLPKQLSHLAPRLFDWSLDPLQPWVELEFYGYLPLSDMYLFGDLDPGTWSLVFDAVGQALEAMSHFRFEPGESDPSVVSALTEMYLAKTAERLSLATIPQHLAPFWAETVHIDGVPCLGVEALLARLPQLAREVDLLAPQAFTVIHGDLCLSNILYDTRNASIRLIDPRGRFGSFDIFGDPRYELAKLSHSVLGDYDFIVNGLFTGGFSPDRGFSFTPNSDERHARVKRLFSTWLARRAGPAMRAVSLIESLLFVSMTPLHADRPASQQAMLARGLSTFTRLLQASESPRET